MAPTKLLRPRGLRFDAGLMFNFSPSIGIMAKQIDKLGIDIRSFREPLTQAIKEVMIPSIQRNFDAEGRPDPWEPLSDFAVQMRGNSSPILNRTGKLKKSMAALARWQISPNFAAITELPSSIWYGNLMQAGYGVETLGQKAERTGKSVGDIFKEIQNKQMSVIETGSLGRTGRNRMLRVTQVFDTGLQGREAAPIPARPFVMFQDDDEKNIEIVFARWLTMRALTSGKFVPIDGVPRRVK